MSDLSSDAIVAIPQGIDTVVWDMGGILRTYYTELLVDHGRASGWPIDRMKLGPTGSVRDDDYEAMLRGDLDERAYYDRVVASLRAEGIDFDPLDPPPGFYTDREVVWALIREIADRPGRRQAILTNDASKWLGRRWWRDWEHRGLFEVIVDSTLIDVRKPDAAAYRAVLARLGSPTPSTTVFVDDMPVNIDAARRVGMRALLFDIADPDDSVAQLRRLIAV